MSNNFVRKSPNPEFMGVLLFMMLVGAGCAIVAFLKWGWLAAIGGFYGGMLMGVTFVCLLTIFHGWSAGKTSR